MHSSASLLFPKHHIFSEEHLENILTKKNRASSLEVQQSVCCASCRERQQETRPLVSPGYSQATFQERSWEQACTTWPGTCVVGSSDPIGLESYSFLCFFRLGTLKDAQQQCCLGVTDLPFTTLLWRPPGHLYTDLFPSESKGRIRNCRDLERWWVSLPRLFLFQWLVWILGDDNIR